MFKALVLVRNLESDATGLDFAEFTISSVGSRFRELRAALQSADVNQDDWIFEKSYTRLPPGPPGSPVGGIPNDIEDILLLLRLYKAGDISFIKQAIVLPNGQTISQLPYRAMNDLNSYADRPFTVEPGECRSWKAFADSIRESQSWESDWFSAARRFFLSGGAKQFNPKSDDVDRILDYATALESALVPERDYNTRRMSHRAAALIAPDNAEEMKAIRRFIRRLYDIRSQIAHGSALGDENRLWLINNDRQIEDRVRLALRTAVRNLPPGEDDRRLALAQLYDPTDEDRAEVLLDDFKKIKTVEVRRMIATKIALEQDQ